MLYFKKAAFLNCYIVEIGWIEFKHYLFFVSESTKKKKKDNLICILKY